MIMLLLGLIGFIIGKYLNTFILKISEEISIKKSAILNNKCSFIGIITSILFITIYKQYGLSFLFIKYVILLCFMIVIAVIDLYTTNIYTKITVSGIVIGLILLITGYFIGYNDVKNNLISCGICWFIVFIIRKLTGGIGDGDPEVYLLCSLYLGWKLTIFMFVTSFLTAGIAGIILIILRKISKTRIPLCPFIALSVIITIYYGSAIIKWYLLI